MPAGAQTNVTIRATEHRMIGGVGELNRHKYFNHWGNYQPPTNTNLGNLSQEVTSATGLNSIPGRDTWEFDWQAQFVPEDPNNPGYFDQAALSSQFQGDYKNFLLTNERYRSLREAVDPITVQSGRAGASWPGWLLNGTTLPISQGGAAYGEFLSTYLEEVVYGTGPGQGYLPFNKDGFYVEIMNEPQWTGVDWNTVIQMHKNVTEIVKADHSEAQIGGASCCRFIDGSPLNNWDRIQQMMDDMTTWSAEFDFWSFHPYERYSVKPDGSYLQDINYSPGHLSAVMDLYETYSNLKFGDPKQFAITEYGSWNRTEMAGGSYGSYDRDTQQWDLVRDVREKLMMFFDRPDRMVNATPFIGARDWRNDVPTNVAADNVFYEQDASGDWHETIVASMYRLYNDVSGEYIPIETDNIDLQTVAFRDGNKVYVVLNNLEKNNNAVNLQAITGLGSVVSASLNRLVWGGTEGLYLDGLDVSGSWQNLTLSPEEGAVLTLTLDGPGLFDIAYDEDTYYSPVTNEPLNLVTGQSSVMPITADLQDAVTAKVRVAYRRTGQPAGESFDIIVNGNVINVPATGVIEFDENDTDMISREIDVPVGLLNDGVNTVQVDFSNGNGSTISTVLLVTRSIGDFNGSGVFDTSDVNLLAAEFGAATPDSRYDLVEDGVIDINDVQFLIEVLRGTVMEDLNLDGFIGIGDLNIVLGNWNQTVNVGDTSLGDPSGDGFVGIDDLNMILGNWNAGTPPPGQPIPQVPEPASLVLMLPAAVWMQAIRRNTPR